MTFVPHFRTSWAVSSIHKLIWISIFQIVSWSKWSNLGCVHMTLTLYVFTLSLIPWSWIGEVMCACFATRFMLLCILKTENEANRLDPVSYPQLQIIRNKTKNINQIQPTSFLIHLEPNFLCLHWQNIILNLKLVMEMGFRRTFIIIYFEIDNTTTDLKILIYHRFI